MQKHPVFAKWMLAIFPVVFTCSPAWAQVNRHLRVMTWNVQSGVDARGFPNLDAQVALMADSRSDVIGLQEVEISSRYLYQSKLQSLTGFSWYTLWIPERRPSNATPMGNLVLSRRPIIGSATTQFDTSGESLPDSAGAAGQIAVEVNGSLVNIIVTRLALDATERQTQADLLVSWSESFGAPRLIGGDLNMLPADDVYQSMAAGFNDAWATLVGTTDEGFTRDALDLSPDQPGRIDYWWHELSDARAMPAAIWVIKTARSGHHAVVLDVDVQ